MATLLVQNLLITTQLVSETKRGELVSLSWQ